MTDQKKRRGARIVLEAIAGLLLGLVFLAGAGIYVLSSGPVTLSALKPIVEEGLNSPGSPYDIRVSETQIVWGGWDRAIDVVATNVSISEADRVPLAVLPEVSVGLSFQALLGGDVRVTTLEVLRPAVNLVRDPDGQILLTVGPEEDAAEAPAFRPDSRRVELAQRETPGLLPAPILDALTAGVGETSLLGGLQRFSIVQAEIRLIDQALGETVWLHSADLDLLRSDDGLDAFLAGVLETAGENNIDVGLGLRVRPLSERIQASLRFSEIDTNIPARFFPDSVFYLPDLTIAGRIDATTDWDGRPLSFAVSLTSAAGNINAEIDVGESLPEMAVSARLSALDPAVWLGGAYDLGNAVDYIPRVPVTGTLSATLGRSGRPETLTADLVSDVGALTGSLQEPDANGLRRAALTLSGFRPDGAAQTAPGLDPLRGVETALDIEAEAALDSGLMPMDGRLSASLGPGRIDLPEFGISLPPTDGGEIRLSYERNAPETLLLERLALAFEEMRISAEGRLTRRDGAVTASATANLTDLQMNRLSEFWPEGLAPNPRSWVTENIPDAQVGSAGLALDAVLPEGDLETLVLEDLAGSIVFEGAEVHYLRPLPPATNVSGEAVFGPDRFDIRLDGGQLNEARLTGGQIGIAGLGGETESIDISLDVDTPLPTALAVLDSEPRRYISRIGLDASGIAGEASAQVRFRFPLLADLDADRVIYETDAVLRGIELYRPDLSGTITADRLDLALEPGRLTLSGTAALDDTPIQIVLEERFDGESERLRSIALSTDTDVREIGRFGLDPAGIAEGRAAVQLNYDVLRAGGETLSLTADLADTILTLEDIGWKKAAGTPSAVALEARFEPDGGVRLERFLLDGGADHRFEGRAVLDQGGSDLLSAELSTLRYGLTEARGSVARRNGNYAIGLSGPRFDIAPFLRDEAGEIAVSGPEDGTAEEILEPRLRITGQFDRLHDGPDNFIGNADLAVDLDGEALRRLVLEGFVGDGRDVDIRYIPMDDGSRTLSVYAEDTGLALAVADITGRLDGGTLEVTGRRASADAPLIGELSMRDFTLREAPRLTKILEVISVTGILSALSDDGLPFSELTAGFSLTEETVEIRDGLARGDSIGITLSGTYDRRQDNLALNGDVAVADLVSRTIGQIPILELLVGEGLIGATYTMSGPLQDPAVSVNPLSVLAPGFLRNIFRGIEPVEGDAVPPGPRAEDRGQ